MIRARIFIDKPGDAARFVSLLNSDGTTDKYTIYDESCHYCFDARSLLSVIAAASDYSKGMFLVNETNDGHFPRGIDAYRINVIDGGKNYED